MDNRILDISTLPARLSIDTGRLVVDAGERKEIVPLRHLGAVIVSCAGVTYTHAVLASLMEENIPFICCDSKHQPSGLLLPLCANSVQTERFRRQTELAQPVRKRLWRQIVQAKIRGQSWVLQQLGKPNPLEALPCRVKSGDTENMEAQAARLYWPLLFGKGFERRRDGCGINARLNYGYAIVRAMTGRALVGAGLHPSLGLHHHNRYDTYCLASDMMEPFRPLVDHLVAEFGSSETEPLCPQSKRHIVSGLDKRFAVEEDLRTLGDIIIRASESLMGVVTGTRKELWLPFVEPANETPEL